MPLLPLDWRLSILMREPFFVIPTQVSGARVEADARRDRREAIFWHPRCSNRLSLLRIIIARFA